MRDIKTDFDSTIPAEEVQQITARVLKLTDLEVDLLFSMVGFKIGRRGQMQDWGLLAIDMDALRDLRQNGEESNIIDVLLSETPKEELMTALGKIENMKPVEFYSTYQKAKEK